MKKQLCALLLASMCLCLSGCGPDFYLTEYETAALQGQFASENNANLFAQTLVADNLNVAGTRLAIQFDMVIGRPQVRSSNLAQQLRRSMVTVENFSENQFDLDRVSGELERQLGTFLANKLTIYVNTGGAEVALHNLDEVIVQIPSAPTFRYRQGSQTITMDGRFNFSVRGSVRVRAVGFLGWLAGFFGGFSGTNIYPMLISVNNYNLRAEARLEPTPDGVRIVSRFNPGAAFNDISVTANGSTVPVQMLDGTRQLLANMLNEPLDDTRLQRYQNFALKELVLAGHPAQLKCVYQPLPEAARPIVHAVSRAADGKLYHSRRRADVWSPWNATPFPTLTTRVDNDPILFASGGEQLELAAIAANHKLVYAHFRDGVWGSQATLGTTLPTTAGQLPDFQGKPALVATAPGQVEIIATGRDGHLWHLRRINGVWQNALRINANLGSMPLRDPVAVQSGDRVAVFFADAANRLGILNFNLETNIWTPGALISTPEAIRYAPAAVASGDGRVDIVCVGASGAPFHRVITLPLSGGFTPGVETRLDGTLNATPELIASGFQQLDLIGRGTDNRLYHRRFVGPRSRVGAIDGRTVNTGWTNWEGLSRYFAGIQGFLQFFNGQMAQVSLASTSSGQLEIVSRSQPGNPQNLLFHTNFDTGKYGRDLWKTVGWQGLKKLDGTGNMTGKPAVVALDQHLEMAFVSNNNGLNNVRFARLAESRVASFGLDQAAQVTTAPNPVAPVFLSNGPGLTDLLYLGSDGVPRHIRRYNSYTGFVRSLSMPPGVSLRSNPAVAAYGNGWLDLVIVGSDNGLYYWRHRNGNWGAPIRLNGSVISAPVLAHVGAGQLELLALGGDQKLYRWRFLNGQWTGWQQLAGNFTIDEVKFGTSAASAYGDGTLDIAVVNAQNGAVYHRRIGGYENLPFTIFGPPARTFNLVGGSVTDTPALLAASPVNLQLMARGTDHKLYSNAAVAGGIASNNGGDVPLAWRGYLQNSQPGLFNGAIAACGTRDYSAIGMDAAGRLQLSRFNGTGWEGFQPLIGQAAETQLGPSLFRPVLAARQ